MRIQGTLEGHLKSFLHLRAVFEPSPTLVRMELTHTLNGQVPHVAHFQRFLEDDGRDRKANN